MSTNQIYQKRLEHAKHRVKKIKGFYTHLLIFITINLFFVFLNIENLEPGESYFQIHNFLTLSLWGIGIIIHGLTVFLPSFILGSDWEERKIKKIMEKDKSAWE
ncbi:2TM domain-containing protein [Lacinutrix jangbogonensis]|uniref:2TM domain-containing protein n=1 Tax=Lacinutrix jangbogonensis TaxID=1469557 RepID=UPI00053E61CE|nr:2TM domain-containing protein [Lacinutrix jangbogonensis]